MYNHSSSPPPFPILLLLLQIRGDLLNLAHEEAALFVPAPDEDAQCIGIGEDIVILWDGGEVLHEKAGGDLDALALVFPQTDLVHDGGGQEGGVFLHLRVSVG